MAIPKSSPKLEQVCPLCGKHTTFQTKCVDAGYMSASALGRPAAAKGKDVSAWVKYCPECGCAGEPDHAPAPCYKCGGAPSFCVATSHVAAEAFGFSDDIPNWPTYINSCDACFPALQQDVVTDVRTMLDEGWFDE